MRHDPQRLEAMYGPLRRRLQAAGLAVAYPHECPPYQADDVLRVAQTQEHLATAPVVTVASVEASWFLVLHESLARYIEVEAVELADVVVALVASARNLDSTSSTTPATTRPRRPRWQLDEHLLADLPVQSIEGAAYDDQRDRAHRRHHEARGWQVLTDETFVRSQPERFDRTFGSLTGGYLLPESSRVWDTSAHAGLPPEQQEEQERDLTLTVLRALRATTHPGENVLVLDWVSTGWRFDPHGPITDAYLESWPRRFLGDETLYWVDPAYRFGIITDWRGLRFRAFGADLVRDLEKSLPMVLQPLAPGALSDQELDARIRSQGGLVHPAG
ncbi:MAG: DUF2716 domain-containing protein [Myxococcaceae bacterium]|nr:MAG: DUF2716 domain-containing protein [Myxococcaceae bacterium]